MTPRKTKVPLYFRNSLTKERDLFRPPHMRPVRMYNCGPTPYDTQHIGNLSAAVFADILRRTLLYNDLEVKQVMNITDFGHLSSDADSGDDKMMQGLKREGLAVSMENMATLAEKYTQQFLDDVAKLGVDVSAIEYPRASKYVHAQIALIQTLAEKGYAYKIDDGVYFDTSLFPEYGALGGIADQSKSEERVTHNAQKKNPADFALWKLNTKLGWDSPWGKGFPGWHIECSAMARALLGEQIDIHTGGIEHISIHHNNEIAQSEAATGKKPFSQFWLHRNHIQIDCHKISKSLGNTVYLSDIEEKGFHPLSLRYWLLSGHYTTPMNFTWQALHDAQNAFLKLHQRRLELMGIEGGEIDEVWQRQFHERINDDLDTPGAIAVLWSMMKDQTLSAENFLATMLDFDRVLGLGLLSTETDILSTIQKAIGMPISMRELPESVRSLVVNREAERKEKNWSKADSLREEILSEGYEIEDTENGPQLTKH